MHMMIEMWIRN